MEVWGRHLRLKACKRAKVVSPYPHAASGSMTRTHTLTRDHKEYHHSGTETFRLDVEHILPHIGCAWHVQSHRKSPDNYNS